MLKIKRIVKKRLPQGFRGLRNCLNAPIIIIGATFLLLVCFPMFTALFLSTTCNSQFGLEWGGKWGQDILDRDSSAKSNIVIPLCGMEAPKVKVLQRSTGKIMVLSLEEYTAGVVAGEMPSSFPYEALKAQAVAARTYAVSKVMRGAATGNSMDHPHAPLCDGPHCQVYRSPKELESIKSSRWMDTQWPIIKNAVKDTRGQVMYYNGSLVEQPLFHSASGGRTENSEDVFVSALPYLRGVESPYESNAPYSGESTTIPLPTFAEKVKRAYGSTSVNQSTIKVISRSNGGRVEKIKVGDKMVSGREIRDLLGLRSANFTISFNKGNPVFTTYGYGHGVGMSQWGAQGMAEEGYDYISILCHYYSGIDLKRLN